MSLRYSPVAPAFFTVLKLFGPRCKLYFGIDSHGFPITLNSYQSIFVYDPVF